MTDKKTCLTCRHLPVVQEARPPAEPLGEPCKARYAAMDSGKYFTRWEEEP